MKKKWLFPFLVILLLTPWPVAYAYDNGVGGAETIHIEAAQAAATPGWDAFGGFVGGITEPGSVFTIRSNRGSGQAPRRAGSYTCLD